MKPEVRPKKALGQHFLTDLGVAERIAATLDDYTAEPVLEIGPGMGVLTRFLLPRHGGGRLAVAEIDRESVDYLRRNFPEFADDASADRIIEGDFLQMDLDAIFPGDGPFCVIGNYPYNISSQIFFKVLDYKDRIVCCSGMLQKDVAERIAAGPVKSGVIRLRRNGVTDLGCDERLFKTIVKATFGQRRKTIRNSLKSLLAPGAVLPDSPLLSLRPEQLSVAQFVELTLLTAPLR